MMMMMMMMMMALICILVTFSFSVFLGQLENAVKTSLYLREYEDVINPVDIYSLLG